MWGGCALIISRDCLQSALEWCLHESRDFFAATWFYVHQKTCFKLKNRVLIAVGALYFCNFRLLFPIVSTKKRPRRRLSHTFVLLVWQLINKCNISIYSIVCNSLMMLSLLIRLKLKIWFSFRNQTYWFCVKIIKVNVTVIFHLLKAYNVPTAFHYKLPKLNGSFQLQKNLIR